MADRVFCIDFGSAFTKIALRRDPTANSALVACAGADVDLCVPTVIAVDRRGNQAKLEFGERATDIKAGGGIDVHANFKKDLFSFTSPSADKPRVAPIDALLESEEFASLAANYAVTPGQVTALRHAAGVARAILGEPSDRTASIEAHRRENAFKLACHFFRWLRREVLSACAKIPATGLKFEDIPVRVTVPALIPVAELAQHPGCKFLQEALHRAGWPLHAEQPLVTEPEANAVGVLTKATNVLSRAGRVNLGGMLNRGPFITALKGDPNHPTYRALVIDVGASTTDFASLFIKTDGKTFAPPAGERFSITQRSAQLGVTDLDASVREVFSKEKREWLEKATRREFLAFQLGTYSPDGEGYSVPGIGAIGGSEDRDAVQACLSDFSNRLADEVAKFCATAETASMQELILTGGGSNIPAVRDALQDAAQAAGQSFVKTHAPDQKRVKSTLTDTLDAQFGRGGSALGGTSIYFEESYS